MICVVPRQLLTSDWAVHIPEEDERDGCELETGSYLSASQIHEIELELLKEKLQEMYLQALEEKMLPEEVRMKRGGKRGGGGSSGSMCRFLLL